MYSSARLYFGRGALMAKALGTTPEEECRPGLAPLARVSDNSINRTAHDRGPTLFSRSANKRTGWTVIYGYRAARGDRVVQGFPSTRFCTVWQSRIPHCDPPRGSGHAASFRPAGTVPPQRGAPTAQTRSVDGHAKGRADVGRLAQAV